MRPNITAPMSVRSTTLSLCVCQKAKKGDKWTWDNDSTILQKVRPGDFIFKCTAETIDEHRTRYTLEKFICLKIIRQIHKKPTAIITRSGFSPGVYEAVHDFDRLAEKHNIKIVEANHRLASKVSTTGGYHFTALARIWEWDNDSAAFPDRTETYRKENGLTYYTVETHNQLFQEYLKSLDTEEGKH